MRTVRDLLDESAGEFSYAELEQKATVQFLRMGVKAIKAFAKGHIEQADVREGRDGQSCWINLSGQTLADLDLEWTCTLTVTAPFRCTLHSNYSVPGQKNSEDAKMEMAKGECTPSAIVELFKRAFGQ